MVTEKIILRGLRIGGGDDRPTIVERIDQEFIPAVLEELRLGGESLSDIQTSVVSPRHAGGGLKLFQPVQRTFNVVLLEALCDSFGFPRVDPERIVGAGFVVRRLAVDPNGRETGAMQAWMQSGNRLRGWLTLGAVGQSRGWLEFDPEADPDLQQRRPGLTTGHAEIDRLLKQYRGATEVYSESVSPLFVAPPEVCQAARRTILYGLIPVTSSERTDAGAVGSAGATRETPYDTGELERALPAHLPDFLQREGRTLTAAVPRARQRIDRFAAESSDVVKFTRALRQLKIEFDAFGDRGDGGALLAQLNEIVLDNPEGVGERRLGQFLKTAASILIDGGSNSLLMPEVWPRITASQEAGFVRSVKGVLQKRLDEFTSGEGRFDDVRPGTPRRYQLRAFIRVRCQEGCPPKLIWSGYSAPFSIAPWYEGGPAPPTQVNLPDALDGNLLRSLKPNVSFIVPERLANVLNSNSPKSFLDGSAGKGDGSITFDWICSFSIPLITICAFIVLNIFLQLFNIIFQWLLFIKICIPFPRRK